MVLKAIKSLFDDEPNVHREPTKQTVTSSGTQSGRSTATDRNNLLSQITGTQSGSATRSGGGTQISGLQDQTLLDPIRANLDQIQALPLEQQKGALDAVYGSLLGATQDATPAGYSSARQGVLQSAADAGRLINAGLSTSGLSANSGAGQRLRADQQARTRQDLLNAYDTNLASQRQQVLGLGQGVQAIGEQQRTAPANTAIQRGAALAPFSRVGTTAQTASEQSQSQQAQTQQQQEFRQQIQDFLNKQKGNQVTEGEDINYGPSNFQNLLGLLGSAGSIYSDFKGG